MTGSCGDPFPVLFKFSCGSVVRKRQWPRHHSVLQQHKHVSLQKDSHPEGGVGPRTVVLRVCGRMRDVSHKHKEWRDLDLSSESERGRAQKHTHRPISSCCGSQPRGRRLVACCHTFPVVTNKKDNVST